MKELDVVTLAVDLDSTKLKKGMKGTIIAVFHSPIKTYEVEFVDFKTGETLEIVTLSVLSTS